ncbi:MAG: hypothetical protein WC497_05150 [Patescibacteria group bacterium]
MDPDIQKKLEEHDRLLAEIFKSTEKTRKYILWSVIGSVLLFIIPLIILMFLIPMYLKALDFSGLGL